MARPIEPTPVLRNKDADRLFKEAESTVTLTAQKRKELDACANLWEKFQSRNTSLKCMK